MVGRAKDQQLYYTLGPRVLLPVCLEERVRAKESLKEKRNHKRCAYTLGWILFATFFMSLGLPINVRCGKTECNGLLGLFHLCFCFFKSLVWEVAQRLLHIHTRCVSVPVMSGSWQKVRQPWDRRQRLSKVALSGELFTWALCGLADGKVDPLFIEANLMV